MLQRKLAYLVLLLGLVWGCDRHAADSGSDTTPPDRINNLMALPITPSTVELTWSAPIDSGAKGSLAEYSIRYATNNQAIIADSGYSVWHYDETPKQPGTVERCTIPDLETDSIYWFAIQTIDQAGNRSPLSNLAIKGRVDIVGLRFDHPHDRTRVADLINLTVSDTGSVPIDRVLFFHDGELLDSSLSSPWTVPWDIRSLPHESSHSIHALAVTANGWQYSSDTITLTVDTSYSSPRPPTRFEPLWLSDINLAVFWSPSREDDFFEYRLTWAKAANPLLLIDSVRYDSRLDTTCTLPDLSEQTDYLLTLTVTDMFGHTTSTFREFTTLSLIPEPIPIISMSRNSSFFATIEWQMSTIRDFDHYELYRSADSLPDQDDQLLFQSDNVYDLEYTDCLYDFSVDNYYYIHQVDTQGYYSDGPAACLPACFGADFALKFDGYNDFATIQADPYLFNYEQWTIEMWVYCERRDPAAALFSSGDNRIGFLMDNERVLWGVSGCLDRQTDYSFPLNQWVHVAITSEHDKKWETLYFDGSRRGYGFCMEWKRTTSDLTIGCRALFGDNFYGMIDEIRIWGRALEAGEVREYRFLRYESFPPGLLAYWNFNEGGGNVAASLSGHTIILGSSDQGDSFDPVWVKSTAPVASQ